MLLSMIMMISTQLIAECTGEVSQELVAMLEFLSTVNLHHASRAC
jgi:hypothetical protein